MDTEQSIHAYLNSLSQLPGSVLYRNDISWEALPPGKTGEVLTLDLDSKPAWESTQVYRPALMNYPTTGNFHQSAQTRSGNQMTIMCRFRTNPVAGNNTQWLWHWTVGGPTQRRYLIQIGRNSHINIPQKLAIVGFDNSNNVLFNYRTPFTVTDGQIHWCAAAFDADGPNARAVCDWQDMTEITKTAGTFRTGIGVDELGDASYDAGRGFTGDIGYTGYAGRYLPNFEDFFDSAGRPKVIDTTTWTEWGGVPSVWNPHGDLNNNLGNQNNYSRNGVIHVSVNSGL